MRLTAEERRRIHETRQKAHEEMFARLHEAIPDDQSAEPRLAVRRLIKTVTIVLLLGGGLLAWQTLEFHLPHSLMEALLPRL